MTIAYWQPAREIESFRRRLDRMFDEMAGFGNNEMQTWQPAVELYDEADRFVLRAWLPGIEAKDLDISATHDSVTLKGEYHRDDRERIYSEFRYGSFERTLRLPVPIQNDKIEANLRNGVLTLMLPKVEEAINRTVKIEPASEEQPTLEAQVSSVNAH